MNRQLNRIIIVSLLLSVLLYSLPSAWGGYPLRGIFVVLILIHLVLAIRNIRRSFPKSTRSQASLLVLNSLAIFHFILIFIYLVIEPSLIWLIGILIGGIVYYVIDRNIEKYQK